MRAAAVQEVIRRWFWCQCGFALGSAERAPIERVERLLRGLGAGPEDRRAVGTARAADRALHHGLGHESVCCGAAAEPPDARMVTDQNSPLLRAASGLVLNMIEVLAGLPDALHLLSSGVLASMGPMKPAISGASAVSLNVEETLIALMVSANGNPAADMATARRTDQRGCAVHLTRIPPPGDEAGLRRLGVNLTGDLQFPAQYPYLT